MRLIQKHGILLALALTVLFSAGVRAETARKTTHQKSGPPARRAATSPRHRATVDSHSRRAVGHVTANNTRKHVSASRGQREIHSDRAREIQQALIREKYLDGEPSGVWDRSTKEAMTRFQNDNGWQTRLVPDARALIKLGLGPSRADLINSSSMSPAVLLPESARDMRPGGSVQQR